MKPVNLNQMRKQRDRAATRQKADENAVRFGRSKAEKTLDAARRKLAADRLAQHQRQDD